MKTIKRMLFYVSDNEALDFRKEDRIRQSMFSRDISIQCLMRALGWSVKETWVSEDRAHFLWLIHWFSPNKPQILPKAESLPELN